MTISKMFFWMSASLVALVTISIIFALSAANTVPGTKIGSSTTVINANALKPTECAALNLTRVVILSRGDTPSNQSELIIGTTGNDNINGKGGSDCILGGAGDDTLNGGNGTDVLMGGPGNDTLNGGTGANTCYGGGQAGDVFNNCATIIP